MGCKNYNSEDGICLCCYEETHDSGDEECNLYDGDKVNAEIASLRAQLAAAQAEIERLRIARDDLALHLESTLAAIRSRDNMGTDKCGDVRPCATCPIADQCEPDDLRSRDDHRTWPTTTSGFQAEPHLASSTELASLRARDEGRVERVAKWMRADMFDAEWDTLDEGEREAWRVSARELLAASDAAPKGGETP